jgi:hypothetical protein
MSQSSALDAAASDSFHATRGCSQTQTDGEAFGEKEIARSGHILPSDVIKGFAVQAVDAPQRCDDEGAAAARGGAAATVSAIEQMQQLRDLLGDMTHPQLRVLARSWNIPSNSRGRASILGDLHAHCNFLLEQATKPSEEQALHRKTVTGRFFGDEQQNVPRRRAPFYDGRAGQHERIRQRPSRVSAAARTRHGQQLPLPYEQRRRRDYDDDSVSSSDEGQPCSVARQSRARSASPSVDLSVLQFDCSICLGRVPSRSTFVLPCCGFEMCQACVKQLVVCAMSDCDCRPVPCPNCACTDRSDDMLRSIAGPLAMLAWNTKLALKFVPDFQQCSSCSQIQLIDRASIHFPRVRCSACAHEFCFEHGDLHGASACPKPTLQHMDSAAVISSISKRCPACNVATERNGGCPHMTCAVCACNWCWTCTKSRDGDGGARAVLLDTNVNASLNLCSLLLFHFLRRVAGPNSVFSAASTCRCGGGSGGNVEWELNGYAAPQSGTVTVAVLLYDALQRSKQWQRVLAAYVCYTSLFILNNVCQCAFQILAAINRYIAQCSAGHYSFFPSSSVYYLLPGPPQVANQIAHALLSHCTAITVGVGVCAMTFYACVVIQKLAECVGGGGRGGNRHAGRKP